MLASKARAFPSIYSGGSTPKAVRIVGARSTMPGRSSENLKLEKKIPYQTLQKTVLKMNQMRH